MYSERFKCFLDFRASSRLSPQVVFRDHETSDAVHDPDAKNVREQAGPCVAEVLDQRVEALDLPTEWYGNGSTHSKTRWLSE